MPDPHGATPIRDERHSASPNKPAIPPPEHPIKTRTPAPSRTPTPPQSPSRPSQCDPCAGATSHISPIDGAEQPKPQTTKANQSPPQPPHPPALASLPSSSAQQEISHVRKEPTTGRIRRRRNKLHGQKPMNHPEFTPMPNPNPSATQAIRVLIPLIPQRIMLGGHNHRRRQPGQVGGEKRTDPRIGTPNRIGHEVLDSPRHGIRRQSPPGRLLPRTRPRQRQIGIGKRKKLRSRHRPTRITHPQTHKRSQVPTGTVPRNRRHPDRTTQLTRMLRGPPKRRNSVIDPGRPGMFGRQPIVNSQHSNPRGNSQSPTQPIMRLQTADAPHPPMHINHQRNRIEGRPIKPTPNRNRPTRNHINAGQPTQRHPTHTPAANLNIPNLGKPRPSHPPGNPHRLPPPNLNHTQFPNRGPTTKPLRVHIGSKLTISQPTKIPITHNPNSAGHPHHPANDPQIREVRGTPATPPIPAIDSPLSTRRLGRNPLQTLPTSASPPLARTLRPRRGTRFAPSAIHLRPSLVPCFSQMRRFGDAHPGSARILRSREQLQDQGFGYPRLPCLGAPAAPVDQEMVAFGRVRQAPCPPRGPHRHRPAGRS